MSNAYIYITPTYRTCQGGILKFCQKAKMYSDYARLRDEKGLTDYAVAKNTGVGRSTLSDWKTGKHIPGPDNLKKIADFFNVPVDFLISTGSRTSYPISDFEYRLILAYRKADEIDQNSINRILSLKSDARKTNTA